MTLTGRLIARYWVLILLLVAMPLPVLARTQTLEICPPTGCSTDNDDTGGGGAGGGAGAYNHATIRTTNGGKGVVHLSWS